MSSFEIPDLPKMITGISEFSVAIENAITDLHRHRDLHEHARSDTPQSQFTQNQIESRLQAFEEVLALFEKTIESNVVYKYICE